MPHLVTMLAMMLVFVIVLTYFDVSTEDALLAGAWAIVFEVVHLKGGK